MYFRNWTHSVITPLKEATARHPILTPLFVPLFLLTSLALIALGLPKGWHDFREADWILVAAADVPIFAIVVYVMFLAYKTRRR